MMTLQKYWNSNTPDIYEFYEGEIGKMIVNEVGEKSASLLNYNVLWALLLRWVIRKCGKYEKIIAQNEEKAKSSIVFSEMA